MKLFKRLFSSEKIPVIRKGEIGSRVPKSKKWEKEMQRLEKDFKRLNKE